MYFIMGLVHQVILGIPENSFVPSQTHLFFGALPESQYGEFLWHQILIIVVRTVGAEPDPILRTDF